jgi:hypothetical protein
VKYPVFAIFILIIISVSKLYSQDKSLLPTDASEEHIGTEEINQYLEKYLGPFFKQHGFTLSAVNEFGYEVSKHFNHVQYTCTCNKLKRLNGVYFESPSMGIRFEEIENPLKELLLKYKLDQPPYTLRDYNNEETARKNRQRISAITIAVESDFAHYSDAVKQYFNAVVFPFFDKYNSIESLNTFIKTIPEDDLTYHIGGEFQLKKMTTLKLCNDPEYLNYAEYVRQIAESIKDLDNGKYIPFLNAYYELAERLEKGLD